LTVLVVAKETPYREYTRLRDPRVLRLLRAKDPTVVPLARANADHDATIRELRSALRSLGVKARFTHDPRSARGDFELIVTVGGDGTLLKTSHHVGPTAPVLAINSAPKYSVGFFAGAKKGGVRRALAAALDGDMRRTVLARMRVEKNGRVLERRVLNEILFCHPNPAGTSRYTLRLANRHKSVVEDHRSSGLWVGPPAGSTAAQRSAGGIVLPLGSRKLQFVVREPYRPHGEPLRLQRGLIPEGTRLVVKNKMQSALIFVDGHHRAHACEIGDELTMQVSEESLVMLGIRRP
jgi:NAD+ kinase